MRHEPERFDLLGFSVTCLHAAAGAPFSLLRWDARPGAGGIPKHFHAHTEEGFYVMSGELGLWLDGQELGCEPGSYTSVAPGQPHSFWNPGSEPATYLTPLAPAGFEAYLRLLAQGLAGAQSDDEATELRERLGQQFDIVVVGPPPH
jgi:mannose-6-phosphate isomerase-like protein (cupin superfamily)